MARSFGAAAAIATVCVMTAAARQLSERPLPGALTHPAIAYSTGPATDAVADLIRRIDAGAAHLAFDQESGYLRSVLDALHVPLESQMLVMSKTGVQGLHTEPSNPRAIYFNDAVTVGYIRGAPLLELAVQDPQQGVIFYTVDQKPQARAAFERPASCLRCHVAYSTLHVPGMLARSQFVAADGLPLGQFGSYDADDRTPFRRRWGGWYVTGTHGAMRHMGNAIVADRNDAEASISERTLNRTSLDGLFDGRGYPSAHSDIAALMVFQHQAHMMNLITRLGWEARIGAGVPQQAVDELIDYALFVGAAPLTSTVKGTTRFAEMFSAQGPFDSRGRTLRQLDLEHGLMKYPCSYMVSSAAFRALPNDVRQTVFTRLWQTVSANDDKREVIEILRETVPDLPAQFRGGQKN